MDLQDLKDIIQKEGGKVIIVENDKPQLVVMSFDEWQGKKKVAEQWPQAEQEQSLAPPSPRPSPVSVDERDERAEGLTIDDLPL